MGKFQCVSVSQERHFDFEKKADVVLSETYRLVPDAEVSVTKPQKESPGGNAKPVDPDGGKRELRTHTTTVTVVTTDPAYFGKYVEGASYDLTF